MSTEMVLKEDKPPKVAPGDQPIVAVVENTQPRVEKVQSEVQQTKEEL